MNGSKVRNLMSGLLGLVLLGSALSFGAKGSLFENRFFSDLSGRMFPQELFNNGYGEEGIDLPFPFKTINEVYELADGEYYELKGYIRHAGEYYYLKIDFNAHPGLKSYQRMNMPYYLIADDGSMVGKYNNQAVSMVVQVIVFLYEDRYGNAQVGHALVPVLDVNRPADSLRP
jgi:hypothetical protein